MDDVLLNKAAIIERCLQRIREEYEGNEASLESNFTQQDSILLNLQRACESSIDAAMHIVRISKFGVPQQSRDAFQMLEQNALLSAELSKNLQAMVGFRNIAVHQYQDLNMEILRFILREKLVDFQAFATLATLLSSIALQGKES